jgi:anti-sigma factor RsiW
VGVRGQITCREIVEIITDYLEGALPTDERARFEQHLLTCGGCLDYLDQMRHAVRLTGSLTEDALEPAQKEALLTAFRDWKSS